MLESRQSWGYRFELTDSPSALEEGGCLDRASPLVALMESRLDAKENVCRESCRLCVWACFH